MLTKQQLFALIQQAPGQTLVVGHCTELSSGCTEFGRQFADSLRTDYISVSTAITEQCEVRFDQNKSYRCLVVCGCGTSGPQPFRLLDKLKPNCQEASSLTIAVMYPAHLSCDGPNQYLPKMLEQLDMLGQKGYQTAFLAGGFGAGEQFNIGFPPLLPAPEANQATLQLPENVAGLLYLTRLHLGQNLYLAWCNRFFAQLAQKHRRQSQPCCYIITGGVANAEALNAIANTQQVELKFIDRLPKHHFIDLLKIIGERNGLVGCNGSMTSLQCAQLRVPVRVLISARFNIGFYQEWLRRLPEQLQGSAREMMGLAPSIATEQLLQKMLCEESQVMQAMHDSLVPWFVKFASLCHESRPALPMYANAQHSNNNVGLDAAASANANQSPLRRERSASP